MMKLLLKELAGSREAGYLPLAEEKRQFFFLLLEEVVFSPE
ncbi:MAG: hypothetical protein ABIK89_24180 [Planctomycetota bacterium]